MKGSFAELHQLLGQVVDLEVAEGAAEFFGRKEHLRYAGSPDFRVFLAVAEVVLSESLKKEQATGTEIGG